MASRPDDELSEGTDKIIAGASVLGEPPASGTGPTAGAGFGDADIAVGSVEPASSPSPSNTPKQSLGETASGGDVADPTAKTLLRDAKQSASEKVVGLKAQATDRARDYAGQGKDRAVGALDDAVRMINDAAATVDEKVGEQYGDYARRAADMVAGLASTLRDKEVDDLVDGARDVVRKSPAVAIGVAAALGFVVARLIKAGVPDDTLETADGQPPRTSRAPHSPADASSV